MKFDSEASTPWTAGRSLAEEHEVVFVEPPCALLRATLRRRLYGDDHDGDDDDEGDNEDDDDDDDEDGADVMTLVDTGRYLVDTSNFG